MKTRVHLQSRGYVGVWLGLLALTGLTFGLAFVDTGAWSVPLAIIIASTKALLVAAFFMHLAEQGGTNRIVAATGFLYVVLLCALMVVDVSDRAPRVVP